MGKFFDSFNNNVAIDLGSTHTRICNNEKGIVLKEYSLVALDKRTSPPKVVEVGNAAQKMLGRAKGEIKTVSPLKHGVIAEMDWAVALLKNMLNRVLENRLIKIAPSVVLSIPGNATGIEKKAAYDALKYAGAGKVYLVERPICASIGAGIDINCSSGSMIVDIGGGSTDIAVMNYGDVVVNNNIRVAGNDFDRTIQNYIRKVKQLYISEKTAEGLKIKHGSVYKIDNDEEFEIIGLDLITKVPVKVMVNKSLIKEALLPPIKYIAKEIKQTLETAPPEIIPDIIETGIVVTGGSTLLNGLSDMLQAELKIPVHTAPDPLLSVIIGSDRIQNDPAYKRLLAH